MSQLTLTLLDSDRALNHQVPLPLARAVVAALSAEPETLSELEAAIERFRQPAPGKLWLDDWEEGVSIEPATRGRCLIDLAGRVVLSRADRFRVAAHGFVYYGDERNENGTRIWFQLADDWLLEGNIDDWKSIVQRRRDERAALPKLDFRPALYDGVLEFLVRESIKAAEKMKRRAASQRKGKPDPALDWERLSPEGIQKVHARWLTTPRDDLQAQTPRDILLQKREWIDFDLRSRSDQWSLTGTCPPGLPQTSAAYRFAGFGSHENMMYYDLIRHLLQTFWHRLAESTQLDPDQEIDRLRNQRDEWLDSCHDEIGGPTTPREIIHFERARIPLTVSGEDALVDCDCPLCQMMADQGPVFVHFDGCHVAEDFVFSFHQDWDEWKAERDEWAELSATFDADESPRPARDQQRIWQQTSIQPLQKPKLPPTPEIQLIGIAGCLAELGVDLKDQGHPERARALNQLFSNIRDVVRQPSDALVEPAIQRMSTELLETGLEYPELSEKCTDLHRQLTKFLGETLA